MSEPRFEIGQSVFYRAGRVKTGPFRILAVLPQRRGQARYKIISQDDSTIEYMVGENELDAS